MGGNKLYNVRNITDLKDMINQSKNLYGNKTAFKLKINKNPIEYKEISYIDFANDISYLGSALFNFGLKNCTINLISSNRYEWAVSYLSVVNGLGVISPLDKSLTDVEIKSLVARSKSKAIIFEKTYLPTILDLIENPSTHNLKIFICMDKVDDSRILYYYDLLKEGKDLISVNYKDYINRKINPDVMNIILFTSGTTAQSKAVMLSHNNIVSNILDCKSYLNITQKDTTLSFLPLHHTFECTANFLLMIYSGATITYCDGIRHLAENIKEYNVSSMICVPILFENMYKKLVSKIKASGSWNYVEKMISFFNILEKIGINTLKLKRMAFKDIYYNLSPNLWLFVSGAAGIDKKVVQGFNDLGILFFQGYGLTETSPVIACENEKAHKPGSVGTPLPQSEIKIENSDKDGIGEIWVKAPYVMLGYYENPEETSNVLQNGWLNTGDLGYIDKEGFLFIHGRKKNVIILKNGKNIFPEEIEEKINALPYVDESMIFGKPDNHGDLDIWAKIVYNKSTVQSKLGNISESDLYNTLLKEIKSINKSMPAYKYIRNIIITDKELIKTTTQKIKRHEELKTLNI